MNLTEIMAYMCSSYSSLSVFALHPLYLRVQALSDAIPGDIKVYRCTPFILTLIRLVCLASRFTHFLNSESPDPVLNFASQEEILNAKKQLDKKVNALSSV
jgi:hypothetical protein